MTARTQITPASDGSVVHCKKSPYDVYIGRGSKYGNPFSHLDKSAATVKVETRDEAVDFYEDWVLGRRHVEGIRPPSLDEIRNELKGKVLGCWCAPKRCHGEVLMKLANAPVTAPSSKMKL